MTEQVPAPSFDHMIYGGTFDPPHQGHVDIVALARRMFPSVPMTIIPSPAPAGAAENHKAPKASFADRCTMLAQALKPLLSHDVTISDIESKIPAPNYTVKSLATLAEVYPGQRFGLIMGEDQLASFAKWRDPHGILKYADLILVGRSGEQFFAQRPWAALAESLDLPIIETKYGAKVEGDQPIHFWVMNGEISPASSTGIRAALAQGEDAPDGWLAGDVVQWIQTHKLYQHAG